MSVRFAVVYCATATARDWPRRERRAGRGARKAGQVLAVENAAGRFICGGCGKALRPARLFEGGSRARMREAERAPP